jgi:hypothetical protein
MNPSMKLLNRPIRKFELPELDHIKELAKTDDDLVKIDVIGEVTHDGVTYPIHSFTIGTQDTSRPTIGLFGGVHGLERVGTQVILSYLTSTLAQLKWDKDLRRTLEKARICSVPLINPVGMSLHSRCNGNGIDLMRNSPVEADPETTYPLLSGHRIGDWLPWYRGEVEKEMEIEAQAVVNFVVDQVFKADTAITIDFHSGFGMKDRLWYPYAKSKEPFPDTPAIHKIVEKLEETLPHHVYKIESQSDSYTTHGDLWDYLYDMHKNTPGPEDKLYLPWTLEMGSWAWMKKNPLQAFSKSGFFNPIKEHRVSRIMRRHLLLIDFFFRMTRNRKAWRYEA